MTAKQYLLRRFIRLYPLFILGLLLGTPVLYVLATYSIPTYPIRSVLVGFAFNAFGVPFLNNLGIVDMGATAPTVIGVIFPSNPPAWSLFFEMIASFAFLFLIKMHFDSLIKIVIVSLTSVASFGVLFALLTPHGGVISSNLGMATDVFLGGFPRVLFGFTLGICLQRFMEDDIIVQRLSFFPITHSYAVYILLVMVLAFPKTIQGLYPLFVLALAGPSIVFMGARIQCRSLTERRLAQFLGWLSYPVYCLHYPIGRAAWSLGQSLQFSPTLTVALAAVTTIVLSIVLTKLAEEPTRRLMSKLFLGRISGSSGKSVS